MDTILGILVESSIRSLVIAAAMACVLWGMRVNSPAIRHRAWTGVLVAMMLLPFLSLWVPGIAIPILPPHFGFQMQQIESSAPERNLSSKFEEIAPSAAPANRGISGPAQTLLPIAVENQSTPPSRAFEIISSLYLAGFCILLARLLLGMLLSYRLVRNATRDDRGFRFSRCTVPLTMGLLQPRILLPMESKQWDTDKLTAVLIHEQEHVRRRDPLVEWLAILNRCIYWFHPLAWWLCGKLAALAEQVCDDAVIARGHDRGAYAELLLEMARSVKQRGALVMVWGSSIHGSTLASRIRRIVTAGLSPAISRTRLILVAALCSGATLIPAICELSRAQAAPFHPPIMSTTAPRAAQPDRTAVQSQPSRSDSSNHSDKILYERGLNFLEKHQYKDARRAFQTLIDTYPDSNLAADSHLAIADSFFSEGGAENLLQAEEQYKSFITFFPDHPKAAEARIKAIITNMRRTRMPDLGQQYSSKAEREIKKFIELFPNHENVPIAMQYLTEVQEARAKEDGVAPSQQSKGSDLKEPYKRWLNEDVVYIVSEEEKKAFEDLKNNEERERFIEQFWARRNPDPLSPKNSFKEEHYRRIAYANEHFASSVPGRKTDRGRVYIRYGPPVEIEVKAVISPDGQVATLPSEYWWYRHIDGIGNDITILFVDRTGTGDYRISDHSPDSK